MGSRKGWGAAGESGGAIGRATAVRDRGSWEWCQGGGGVEGKGRRRGLGQEGVRQGRNGLWEEEQARGADHAISAMLCPLGAILWGSG